MIAAVRSTPADDATRPMPEIDLRALAAYFAAAELEWRIQSAGEKNGRPWAICVPYVDNRAIQARLDDVCGPANWRNEFRPGPVGGVLCGISIRVGDEWITKWDGAENTDVEGVKGGLSGAMKRAAVQWGIGRYLYGLDNLFAQIHENGQEYGKTKDGRSFRWDPPRLPAELLPSPPLAAAAEVPPADRAPDGDQEAMLEFVRAVGPRVGDDAEIRIQRRVRNLRDFVRENWPVIKEQPRITRAVVEAIEAATGTAFQPAGGR